MNSGETKSHTTQRVLVEESVSSSVRFFGLSINVEAFKTNHSDSENVTNNDF